MALVTAISIAGIKRVKTDSLKQGPASDGRQAAESASIIGTSPSWIVPADFSAHSAG
jgi:hypothetical protein